ncbi:glycosyltransferase [Pseudoxanthomonas japonensis]|uniref:Glycosyltransferase subfamily 4-like N-terminal domain-containing protein n=1 Tax=Pseudoxanthomonas japonensis TaxID=69284 RepID=A0ABQ6ZH16_9GAMM|nr:glycosyltransferase [Pseudoxanthomonas japonensis]KAF1725108.1 hypothetical protein CSC78_10060 [Pseudoxanthomonas japonensis]
MHILLIAYEFPPSPSPQSLRWTYLARYLAERGHRISVLTINLGGTSTGLPALPADIVVTRTFAGPVRGCLATLRERRHRRGLRRDRADVADIGGVPALAPTNSASRQGWKQALSDLLQGAAARVIFPDVRGEWLPWARRRLDRMLETDPPDLVISSHEPATSLQLGLRAKRRGLPWIADLGDPVLAPYTPARWRRRAWMLERKVAETADHILVTTPAAAALLAERHHRDAGVTVVTQGHAGDHPVPPGDDGLFAPYRLELLYTGSFYRFRRPDALLEALRELPEARLNIASVALPASVIEFARELPDQVRVLGFLPHAQALDLQRRADVLVNIGNADPSQVPGKIYEYLGACRPILHLGDADDAIATFVAGLRRGWSCENREGPIAERVRSLIADKRAGRFADGLDLGPASVAPWHWRASAATIDALARSLVRKA